MLGACAAFIVSFSFADKLTSRRYNSKQPIRQLHNSTTYSLYLHTHANSCMYIHTKACRVGFLRRRLHALIYTYSVFTLVALNRLYYETIIYIKKIYAYAHQNFLHFIERIFSRLPHSSLRYQNLARIWQYMRER